MTAPQPSPSSGSVGGIVTRTTDAARQVQDFHRNDDFNSRDDAHHHGLGQTHEKAAWGDHAHDGNTGRAILEGTTFTGSRTSNVATILNQICNALVELGAVNSTSA